LTEVTQDRALTHLSPAESRLSAVFARPKTAVWLCIVVLTSLGWVYLAFAAGAAEVRGFQGLLAVLCRPTAGAAQSAGDFALLLAMWVAMVFAMMLPTAGPMIFTYAEIADTAVRRSKRVVSPFWLAAGYAAVWLGFAILAAALQAALMRFWLLEIAPASRVLSATLFALAGVYQFTSLKQACLSVCQRPFPFFFANWTTHPRGVLLLGLRQGLHCLGCCWAMMLLMLATGAMNVVWMAALGILMTAEKMSATQRLSRIVGVGFLAVAAGFLAALAMRV
jgi:predicted metal-binding membrane protein